jgi:hypothetical protein
MTEIRITKAVGYTVQQTPGPSEPAANEVLVTKAAAYAVPLPSASTVQTTKAVAYAVRMPAGAVQVTKAVAYAVPLPLASAVQVTKALAYAVRMPADAVRVTKAVGAGVELRWPLRGMWYRTQAGDWVAVVPYGCLGGKRVTEERNPRVTEAGDRRLADSAAIWHLVDEAFAKRIATVWGQMYPMEPKPPGS